ncbi:MAG: response regulator transcription factor [Bacteroidia bacterium]|nr:response regulator transcription factor [Bacteroidia bacterium]
MKTCIIADNQFITNFGITRFLREKGFSAVVNVNNVAELREELNKIPNAIVLLDYMLLDFTSVRQMLEIKAGAKKSGWILFSDEIDEPFLRQVLETEPQVSVVTKYDSEKAILEAFHCAENNRQFLCETAKQALKNQNSSTHLSAAKEAEINLTASEKQVLREIATGKTTKEIAFEKNVSFHTINSHRKNIFRKLQVNNLHDAIKYAIRTGIFDVTEYYI